MQHLSRVRQAGFSLLELAIVLAVAALIMGGVLVGQDLLRSAQLRAITGDIAKYTQAIGNFHDKYKALPGDFSGAEALWGTDPAGCPSTAYVATAHAATCNGDGNGTIGNSDATGIVTNMSEWYRAWQHLADAGMIDGSYNGMSTTPTSDTSIPGTNVPASLIPNSGYSLFSVSFPTGVADAAPVSNDRRFASLMTHPDTLESQTSDFLASILLPTDAYAHNNCAMLCYTPGGCNGTCLTDCFPPCIPGPPVPPPPPPPPPPGGIQLQGFWPVTGSIIAFGGQTASGWTNAAVLTPAEAWSIDSKMDDGIPGSGTVLAYKSTVSPGCATSDTLPTQYNTSVGDNACALMFVMPF